VPRATSPHARAPARPRSPRTAGGSRRRASPVLGSLRHLERIGHVADVDAEGSHARGALAEAFPLLPPREAGTGDPVQRFAEADAFAALQLLHRRRNILVELDGRPHAITLAS